MEESPAKPSVVKLAGIFKNHPFPVPGGPEEKATAAASPHPPKTKNRNSALIEKLQANLTLTPVARLPTTRNPEVKPQPRPTSASPPRTPPSGSVPELSKEEVAASFEKPADGAVLRSFNKGRARVSVKRRPPTRQHRKSCADEQWEAEDEDETPPLSKDSPLTHRGQQRAPDSTLEALAQKPSQTSKAEVDGLDSAHKTRTDVGAPAEGTGTQNEGRVCAPERTAKRTDFKHGDGEAVPEGHRSVCKQEPQPKTCISGTAENTKNQAGSPGD